MPLYSKLTITITVFALLVALGLVTLFTWSSTRYHQEVTQKLHQDLAQYVLEHLPGPLYLDTPTGDVINQHVLKATAVNTMEINPSVEVYLLDGHGRVLDHALPGYSIQAHDIDVSAIHRFLEDGVEGPVLGQNPLKPSEQTIFSAAPVSFGGEMKGYLYVVLASSESSTLATQLSGSHIARLTLGALLGLILFLGLSAFFSFRRITRPLRQLSSAMKTYRQSALIGDECSAVKDEVGELECAFELMKARIQEQFEQLSEADRLRRELVSNVSHDLRTPLASMQGYLETLLIKADSLSHEQQQHYLRIAHRHSNQLNLLISQLFELSKLESGKVEPDYEMFSMSELLFDMQQDFALKAEHKNIHLEVRAAEQNAMVNADISLIHRALQNLIDNALKHTPEHGQVYLNLTFEDGQVIVSVTDSGKGIEESDIPFVFDRFYQSGNNRTKDAGEQLGAGLGLSIVKKIMDLHGALVQVNSVPQKGTSFAFSLPRIA